MLSIISHILDASQRAHVAHLVDAFKKCLYGYMHQIFVFNIPRRLGGASLIEPPHAVLVGERNLMSYLLLEALHGPVIERVLKPS